MTENELNDIQGEVPAIPTAELEGPEVPEAPEADATEKAPDDAPDPANLKAEIEQLKADKEKAKEAAKKWRKEKAEARADYFKNREPAPAAAPPPSAATKPNSDDFDDYNDYTEALTDWKVDQKKAQWDQEEVRKAQDVTHQEKMQSLHEKINAGYEKYPDFEDVALAQTVPITQMITEILAETENPADIAYYLGKNQTKAVAIGRMTPIAAARAIAQIEAEISAAPTAGTKTKKTTNAPPPIKPIGSSHTVAKDPEKMTQNEYEEYRRAQGAKPY